MFGELAKAIIDEARTQQYELAVLFVDLDHFKEVNDTLGHDAGDQLLKEMARRLRHCMRSSDFVARLGGDEFVILVRPADGREEVALVARKLLAAASTPVQLGSQQRCVSASVGISMFPGDARDEGSLMRYADMAMYVAKACGKNTFRFYAQEVGSASS
jgi:diguanylate cyclase (GGDEF)-like protein